MMNLKEGQKVRVFGVLKESWVLGQVVNFGSAYVTVLIQDWVGLSSGLYTLPHSQVERIADGNS
jgi:hypothetical protein